MKNPAVQPVARAIRTLVRFTCLVLSLASFMACKKNTSPQEGTGASLTLSTADTQPVPNCPIAFNEEECAICRDLETSPQVEATQAAGDPGKAKSNPCGIDEPGDRTERVLPAPALDSACRAHRDCLKEALDHGARGGCHHQFLTALRSHCESQSANRQNCMREAFQTLGVCHHVGGLTQRNDVIN